MTSRDWGSRVFGLVEHKKRQNALTYGMMIKRMPVRKIEEDGLFFLLMEKVFFSFVIRYEKP